MVLMSQSMFKQNSNDCTTLFQRTAEETQLPLGQSNQGEVYFVQSVCCIYFIKLTRVRTRDKLDISLARAYKTQILNLIGRQTTVSGINNT